MVLNVVGSISEEEKKYYEKYILDKHPQVKTATVTVDGEYVDLDYDIPEIHFDRIRRITNPVVQK